MSVKVELKLSRLRRVLQGEKAAIDRGAKAYAEAVKELASQLAPLGDTDEPGYVHLRDSGEVEPIQSGAYKVVFHSDHAAFVEFGTARMAAQPYLTPATQRVAPLPFFARELAKLVR